MLQYIDPGIMLDDNSVMTKESALELFGLEDHDVESIHYKNVNGNALIEVQLKPHYEPCPDCGALEPWIKDYRIKRIRHSVLSDRKCTLVYNARRYQCTECRHVYLEKNPFVFKKMRISAKTVMNILDDLKDYNETFSSVARRYGVSPTTVASIFDSHVRIPRKTLPEMISIDECYAFRHHSDKYICVLLDFQTNKPIDILNSRRKEILESYFMAIDPQERKKVKAVSFDMSDVFRSVAYQMFENCIGIVDRFHLCQEYGRRADSIRIRVMKGCEKKTDQYYLLKKFSWMLYTHNDSGAKNGKTPIYDPNHPRKYNHHFRRYLNYYEIREMMLAIHPDLRAAWNFKEDIYDFYKNNTVESAPAELDKLIEKMKDSKIAELEQFSKTLRRWRTEIINSLTVFDYFYDVEKETGHVDVYEKRMHNGIIENRNAIIKCVKKNANGYTNWSRFRNRLLYVLDPDANYYLNPLPELVKK